MLATKAELHVSRELLPRLSEARRRTDELFDLVRPDSLYDRPIPERHRIIFYIGHLEAFDLNLLNGRLLSLANSDPDLDRLFAFGIDPVGGGLPTDQPSDWPSLGKVRQYVQRTRDELDEGLGSLRNGPHRASAEFSSALLLNVAIEHRLMHAETLAYMLHRLPYNRKNPRPIPPRLTLVPDISTMIEVPQGPAMLGLERNGDTFGWDNEYERHWVDIPAFAIDRYKIRNSEYLDFINSGGYANRTLWSDADWQWKETNGISHPAFWRQDDNGREWFWKGMFNEIPLPPDWPAYVSHAEASAYARWAGKSLPTEDQWQRAAYGSPDGQGRQYPFGVEDMLGNGWEWTSTVFAPFAGFEPFPFYPGYSADFFDGKHYVIKGASMRTAACMLRPSFRNWFQPHYQYVYAGFRCVSNPLA